MRLLVCGDREWNQFAIVFRELDALWQDYIGDECNDPDAFLIIEGGCDGADIAARYWAQAKQVAWKEFPVTKDDWNKHGKAAGPIRNQQMLDEGKPDLVIAFHSNIAKSKGTWDMIKRANKAGIPVRIYAK